MKIVKLIFILVVTLNFNNAFSQVSENIKIDKKSILKIFKSTVEQENKNKIKITSNPWFSDENKYLKSDTIKFTNANSYNRNYCRVINWTFYTKNKFIRSFGNYCEEPPTEKVTNKNDYFDLKVNEFKEKTFIQLYNQNKLIENFEILSLEKTQSLSYKNEIKYILTLKRIK